MPAEKKVVQDWPAVMNNRTVRQYLDCPSPYYWRIMKRLLLEGGYSGFQKRQTFHRRDLIDEALGIENRKGGDRQRMLDAAKD